MEELQRFRFASEDNRVPLVQQRPRSRDKVVDVRQVRGADHDRRESSAEPKAAHRANGEWRTSLSSAEEEHHFLRKHSGDGGGALLGTNHGEKMHHAHEHVGHGGYYGEAPSFSEDGPQPFAGATSRLSPRVSSALGAATDPWASAAAMERAPRSRREENGDQFDGMHLTPLNEQPFQALSSIARQAQSVLLDRLSPRDAGAKLSSE
jgi:hypothetical protein